jgi:hypothetical protein
MRVIKLFTASVATSLLLAAVAHAADTPAGDDGSARKSEVVSGAGLPWNVDSFQRVSPANAQHSAEPDWTSKIGTGMAAALERR